MSLLRFLALVVVPSGLVVLFAGLYLIGDEVGEDTSAVRFAFAGTACLSVVVGRVCGRWLRVGHAAWSLPVGVGVTMFAWFPVRRPAGLSMAAFALVVLAWVCALTVVSIVSRAIGRRHLSVGVLFAAVAAVLLVAAAPLLAVALGVGPTMATVESLGTWLPFVLSDRSHLLATPPRLAAEIASMVVVLAMTGTCFVLAYVTRPRTARFSSEMEARATVPQTAS